MRLPRMAATLSVATANAPASRLTDESASHAANKPKAGRKRGPRQNCASDNELCNFRQWSIPCCNPKAVCTYNRYAGLNITFAANTRDAHCRTKGTLVKGSMVLAPARGAASFLNGEAVHHGHDWVSSWRAVEDAIAKNANAIEESDIVARISHQQGPTPRKKSLLVAGFILMVPAARAVGLTAALARAGAAGIEVELNRKLVSFGLDHKYGKVNVTNMTLENRRTWGLPQGYEGKYIVPLPARSHGASSTGGAVFLKMPVLASLGAVAVSAVATVLVWLRRRSRQEPAFSSLQTEQC